VNDKVHTSRRHRAARATAFGHASCGFGVRRGIPHVSSQPIQIACVVRPGKSFEWIAMIIIWAMVAAANAQQVVDPDFYPVVDHPEYKPEAGPLVMIDEAHFNYHTATGQYEPFARVLRLDGFRVQPFKEEFSSRSLRQGNILVIANAMSQTMAKNWAASRGSAFSKKEIAALRDWVRRGGALILIVDHMPSPGSIEKLALAFGVKHWSNGYAQDPTSGGLITFRRGDGALADHAITDGRSDAERIGHVVTFAGSAFEAPPGSQPILTFTGDAVSWLPKLAGKLEPGTPSESVKGWQQGAVLQFGKGRVALFGEAAMFTAQRVGPGLDPNGMNTRSASQNQQFLLNIFHWLAGSLQ
jgi:hypothetical protein